MRNHYEEMQAIFEERGWFGATRNYRRRPGQVQMAAAVSRAIETGEPLFVEGPTGTGKSLAYLVPAAIAAGHGLRTIIATANTNLQSQLNDKDLPTLVTTMPGWKFRHSSLKGVQHYFCELEAETAEAATAFMNPREKEEMEQLILLHKTKMWSGDKAALVEEPSQRAWSAISTDSYACQGNACPKALSCWAMRMRMDARTANIVVTNYHMLFSDLLAEGQIFGKVDILICDEAHHMADIAREFFGGMLSVGIIGRAARRFRRDDEKKMLMTRITDFFDEVAETYFPHEEGTCTINTELRVDPEPLVLALRTLWKYYDAKAKDTNLHPGAIAQAVKDRDYVANLGHQALALCYHADKTGGVTFVKMEGGKCSIQNRQADVRGILGNLFHNRGLHGLVFTSATLSDGRSFEFVKHELGLPHASEVIVESPFELDKQMAIFIARDLPAPSGDTRGAHLQQAAYVIADLIVKNRGRCLVLFTSKQALEFTQRVVKQVFEEKKIDQRIYVQGTLSKPELVRRFKEEVASNLFGLASFWEGVDVPGESLSCLIIHKLPFPTPDDPVIKVLEQNWGQDAFNHVSVPRAALALRQGHGRLIRSITDMGVVVFLDPRVVTRPYGKVLLRGLENVPRYDLSDFEKVVRSFDAERSLREADDILCHSVYARSL